jgi:Fe-S cluster biogenesis protein NfuA
MNDPHEETSADIAVYPTPNPDALMFHTAETLVPGGVFEFISAERAEESGLARAIFRLGGVAGVLIARNHVTVTRGEGSWQDLIEPIKGVIASFLESGELVVEDSLIPKPRIPETELEARIVEVIEESIRPAISQDGGDVEYMGFDDGIVELRLQGACGSCPHATATLAQGIQRFLMEHIPEVKGVRRVW